MDLKDIATVVVACVIATVALGIGQDILDTIKTDDRVDSVTVTNESINFVANNTYYAFDYSPMSSFTALYADAANTNAYDTTLYSYETGTGARIRIYTNGTGGYPNMTTGIAYATYTSRELQYNITESTQGALENFGDWLPTILLVVASSIVLGLVIKRLAL